MLISGHFHALGMRKPHFQYSANWEVATTSPRFCNEPHLLHVLFVKIVPGTTFTSRSKPHFVVTVNAKQQVRKAFHCRTKQQWKSHVVLILFRFVWATWVLFFTLIPFVVKSHIYHNAKWEAASLAARLGLIFEMIESERNKQNANWENLDINNLQSILLQQHWAPFSRTYQAPFYSMLGAIS